MSRLCLHSDGTYKKHMTINGKCYVFTIAPDVWNTVSHRIINNHIYYAFRNIRSGNPYKLKYGRIQISSQHVNPHSCNKCNKTYNTRSGFLKHMKRHHTNETIQQININNAVDEPPMPMTNDVTYDATPLDIDISSQVHMTDVLQNTRNICVKPSSQDFRGYVYCFSTESMPGTYKIGMTTRDVETRLKEANQSNTWKPPIPYKIVFSKYVRNPLQKERSIHKLLEDYRVTDSREFFKIDIDKLTSLFDVIDEIPGDIK